MFLGSYPFLLGCQICRHILFHMSLSASVVSVVIVSSFILILFT